MMSYAHPKGDVCVMDVSGKRSKHFGLSDGEYIFHSHKGKEGSVKCKIRGVK